MARAWLGAARRSDRHRRDRRGRTTTCTCSSHTAEEFHADPEGVTERWIGQPARPPEIYTWPAKGPGFRPAAALLAARVPLRRVGRAEPALRAPGDRRLRRARAQLRRRAHLPDRRDARSTRASRTTSSRCTPTATIRGCLRRRRAPWLHLQAFVYLNDVDDGNAATHIVSRGDERGHKLTEPLVLPNWDRELYAVEQSAPGVRGSVLAYGSNVFHRGVDLRRARHRALHAQRVLQAAPGTTGSASTRHSRSRRRRAGLRSPRAPRRASSRCSGFRCPAIRSGPTSCSTRPPSSIRSSTSHPGALAL